MAKDYEQTDMHPQGVQPSRKPSQKCPHHGLACVSFMQGQLPSCPPGAKQHRGWEKAGGSSTVTLRSDCNVKRYLGGTTKAALSPQENLRACCCFAGCFMNAQPKPSVKVIEMSLHIEPIQDNICGKQSCGTVRRLVVKPGLQITSSCWSVHHTGCVSSALSSLVIDSQHKSDFRTLYFS